MTLYFTDNTMYYEIPAAPYQRFTLEFSCNFYVKGAKEHRGEEKSGNGREGSRPVSSRGPAEIFDRRT